MAFYAAVGASTVFKFRLILAGVTATIVRAFPLASDFAVSRVMICGVDPLILTGAITRLTIGNRNVLAS